MKMKKSVQLFLLILLMIFIIYPALIAGAKDKTAMPCTRAFVSNELLIKYKSFANTDQIRACQRQSGIIELKQFKKSRINLLKLPDNLSVDQAMELFNTDPSVEFVEPNYYYRPALIPNDPFYNKLWGADNTGQSINGSSGLPDADIDLPEAWNITTGNDQIVVAIIDTGVDLSHPDLYNNIWLNKDEIPDNQQDDDNNGYIDDVVGWDFVDNDNLPDDSGRHGTHVAGTIAAAGNNEIGISGISWNVKIMVLRFINALNYGTTSDAVRAIEYANDKGAQVINCSWGSPDFSLSLKEAIRASDALVVCSAGNDGQNIDNQANYPAAHNYSNMLATAASNPNDTLANFSNYSSVSVDVVAPGTNIYSCRPARRKIWGDDFNDLEISDWSSGGINNSWQTTDNRPFNSSGVLAQSPDENYKNQTNTWIRTPALNLSEASGSKLTFYLFGRSELNKDYLFVETSQDGTVWIRQLLLINNSGLFTGISGNTSTWTKTTLDLGGFDGCPLVYIRFRFSSNEINNDKGWYIDDIKLTAASSSYNGSEYCFISGTSMAAAYVSGLAALIYSKNSSFAPEQVKKIIENSVDIIPVLAAKIKTSGRINAYRALLELESSDNSSGNDSSDQNLFGQNLFDDAWSSCFITAISGPFWDD